MQKLPQFRTLSLISILTLLILAIALPASCGHDTDQSRFNPQICFPESTDVLVSNTNQIPNMKIVETKTFVMVARPGHDYVCATAITFMEQVRHHGGNAVIGFSTMIASDVHPQTRVVFYGTAVVVEPAVDQITNRN